MKDTKSNVIKLRTVSIILVSIVVFNYFVVLILPYCVGLVIIRDPRVSESNNDRFLDMMERYFESSDGVADARPEYHYQVGVTPAHIGF